MQSKFSDIRRKSKRVIDEQGFSRFVKISARHVYRKAFPIPIQEKNLALDILFINGTTLPHPERYRVDHQIEQLSSNGMTADKVYYENLTLDMLKYYRGFVFFRCPVTDTVKEFISKAKKMNKTCFFDIDDLVIDKKYTDTIKFVAEMDEQDKAHYDDGVSRMNETLSLSDYGIVTTERLKSELSNYGLKEVYINRNTASDEMIRVSLDALNKVEKDPEKFVIGYFSGSITHNEDFESIQQSIIDLMSAYPQVYLKVVGLLSIPNELKQYKDRIITVPFMDWRKMPLELSSCDVNIAPLVDSIFNEAKSENKWIEASLVKVVTVASNIGAFKKIIENQRTGLLVNNSDDWFLTIKSLIEDQDLKHSIAEAAFNEVIDKHTTISSGYGLSNFIEERLAPSIAFVLPTSDISGGVNVVLKHADILLKNGYDVTIIDLVNAENATTSRDISDRYNVLAPYKDNVLMFFDNMVATLWSTLPSYINSYPNKKRVSYFVQNFETGFMEYGDAGRKMANSTYAAYQDVNYMTMSLWCQKWLKEKFGKNSQYASNGIDIQNFNYTERNLSGRKIKILIEGDSKDHYKKVDESFKVVEQLDFDKYEISYLSYRSKPKDWYHVDYFYNKISPEKVGEIYANHDILIKSSLLESFSYPPLEMMATGGVPVVVPNDGNAEYIVDKENCLTYPSGNISKAVELIEELTENDTLFKKISIGGRKTAESYTWDKKEEAILALYPIEKKKKDRLGIAVNCDNAFSEKGINSSLNQHDVYKKWVLKHYPDSIERLEQQHQSEIIDNPHLISVVIPIHNPNPKNLIEAVESILGQTYPYFELILVNDSSTSEVSNLLNKLSFLSNKIKVINFSQRLGFSSAIKSGIEMSEGEFLTVLEQDDLFWPNAFYEFVQVLHKRPDIKFIYCDEDKVLNEERFNHFDPFFKPDWNPDFLLSTNYIEHGFLCKKDLLKNYEIHKNYEYEAEKWAFNLWISRHFDRESIYHIEKVLYSWRVANSGIDRTLFNTESLLIQQKELLIEHMEMLGNHKDDILVTPKIYAPSVYDVHLVVKDKPLVSIVIPNKNQYEILKRCVDSLYSRTKYKNFEVIIVDTGSRDSKILSWYNIAKERYTNFQVYKYEESIFNYSNSCNFGATKAKGSFLVMLNNDTEIIQDNWLEIMLGAAQQKQVGCVGVQLWYPGHRALQHTGIATGVNGVATNLMNGMLGADIITNVQKYYTNFSHTITAVTAACMMIKTSIFNEVSGFDSNFRVTFNDVDLCLKVIEKGYRNIYLSDVELIHHESISVGHVNEEHRERNEFKESEKLFNCRWASYIEKDPNFNENFSKVTSKFEIPNDY
ncbi:glycosyltransferase [Enterococcus devriesei]|uniref:glycosyltransferase n=1 Tax=Enterococcus devriesei TaxID=319970 RepID=UPI001C1282F8|nr:glycosyltransferase [Enterococcus devriesei]MBU5364196.1 glycosyltransferase [Enterococcus devriesei]